MSGGEATDLSHESAWVPATSAPAPASARAIARPIPRGRAQPVTTATDPNNGADLLATMSPFISAIAFHPFGSEGLAPEPSIFKVGRRSSAAASGVMRPLAKTK